MVSLEQMTLELSRNDPLPIQLPFRTDVVSLWTLDPGEGDTAFDARIRLLGPDGELLKESETQHLILHAKTTRTRVTWGTDELIVSGDGVHLFVVEVQWQPNGGWTVEARIPLAVTVLRPPAQ